MDRSILSSFREGVAVLDEKGVIVSVNEAWECLAVKNGPFIRDSMVVGADYVEICRSFDPIAQDSTQRALKGLTAILDGSRESVMFEYLWETPTEHRWFLMKIIPLQGLERGAVILHADITERKRFQTEIQHSRSQLAHVQRASTISELASSLAHELNQPLAAVLSNAQTALRLLTAASPDLQEIKEILDDVVSDDKRAGEIIRRMRGLLKKQSLDRQPLQINDIIYAVSELLHSDAIIRQTGLSLELAPDLPIVYGDPVQLEQVLLNLMLNGMESMKTMLPSQRILKIQSRRADHQTLEVSVKDLGAGFGRQLPEQVFEPFYTTKKDGLGMGLPISRSIVEAHQGRLWAEANSEGGATFRFVLPLCPAEKSAEENARFL